MVCLFPSAWVVLVLVSIGNLLEESKRTWLPAVSAVCMSQRPQGCCPRWVGGSVVIRRTAFQGGGDEDAWQKTHSYYHYKQLCLHVDIGFIAARGAREHKQTQRRVCFVRRLNQHCVTPLPSCHLCPTTCFDVFMVRLQTKNCG